MRYTIFGQNSYRDELSLKLDSAGHTLDDENPDFIFSIGGDGTVLRAIHKYIKIIETVKFIGINLGRLGFYTDFEEKEIDLILSLIDSNQYQTANYNLLEYLLKNDGMCKAGFGLNEISIINPIHTQIIDVFIDDKHFETFRGTGFIASTPTGSTAYNKSLGGSVIDPKIKALQLTEVASINNRVYKTLSSPLVLSNETLIRLQSDFQNASITIDGIFEDFKDINEILVRLSTRMVSFVIKHETDFWDRVKKSFLE
jgi:NAD+ kinase